MVLKDRYFTIFEAAEYAGVTRQTISRWITNGEIPYEKVGRNKLILRRALTKYIREKPMGEMRKMVTNDILEHPFGFLDTDEGDRVEVVGHPSDLIFLITRKDGSSEKIQIEDFTLTRDNTVRSLTYRTEKKRGK